jgi:HAD superfamily hydrolase (TIGR01484 family)
MMHFSALATDYDGTIAHDGMLEAETIAALERLKASGRRLIMVTGRELDELQTVCPRLDIFDLVVAENGALLYDPASEEEILLTTGPSAALVERLKAANVPGLSVGRSIIATWEPYETVVLEAIKDLGLELQIIFNKGAVMVLPSTVNKATGLAAALDRLELAPECVVGVGDAENDHAFIRSCGCGVAVANAIPSLKAEVDIVTGKPRGEGVVQLIDDMIKTDLAEVRSKRLARTGRLEEQAFDETESFWFRGPKGALNLRAQSLPMFLQIGAGVDEETWMHHLRAGDFSRWFEGVVRNPELAERVRRVEADETLDPAASREAIRALVEGAQNAKSEKQMEGRGKALAAE